MIMVAESFAQTHLGGKAGSGISYFRNQKSNYSLFPRMGGSVGIYFQNDITDHFSMREEILLTFAGSGYRYWIASSAPDQEIRQCYQFNYIELPVTAIYKIGNNFKYYATGGFSLRFNVYSKLRTTVNSNQLEFDPVESKGLDFTLLGGIGVEKTIKSYPAHLEIRYSHGFTQVIEDYKISSIGIFAGIKI